MMRKRTLVSAVLLFLAASLYSASLISSPAAIVNLIRNTPITVDQLDEEYQRYVDMGAAGITKTDVLQTLINDEVFLQGAERDGITVSDSQIDPLWTVMREGGPYHTQGHLAEYLKRLEATGRSEGARKLRERYGV